MSQQVSTLYGSIPNEIFQLMQGIRLVALDVDGVLSDGRIYLGNNGEEFKSFNAKDGLGIKAMLAADIQVAVITGRRSQIVSQRMQSLGVTHVIQGEVQKRQALASLQQQLGINSQQTASVGDDLPDIGMFEQSSLAVCVADGHPSVKQAANLVTHTPGGMGAVRELADILLQAQGQLGDYQGSSA